MEEKPGAEQVVPTILTWETADALRHLFISIPSAVWYELPLASRVQYHETRKRWELLHDKGII